MIILARFLLCLTLVCALAPIADAQILNGDFEQGCANWTALEPPNWTVGCDPDNGNPGGYGFVRSPVGNSGGEGCLVQVFDCGTFSSATQCVISFDYSLLRIDAAESTAYIVVYIDGAANFTSDSASVDWSRTSIAVPCGQHTISLCLKVDPGNNLWQACFDNVVANCEATAPVRPGTWGTVKALYGGRR